MPALPVVLNILPLTAAIYALVSSICIERILIAWNIELMLIKIIREKLVFSLGALASRRHESSSITEGEKYGKKS